MKVSCTRYGYPGIVIVATISMLAALGIIYWHKNELKQLQFQGEKIAEQNRMLASLKEKINFLKQQEAVFSQKKKSAQQALQEAENALTKLAKEKADAQGVITRAASAGKEESLAKKNLGELTVQINLLKARQSEQTKTILKQQIDAKNLQNEIQSSKNQLAQLQKIKVELSSCALEYERVKQNLNTASNQYASLRKETDLLQKQLTAGRQSHQEMLRKIELTQLQLQSSENALKDRDSLKKQIISLQEQHKALLLELDNIRKQKFDLIAAKTEYNRLRSSSNRLLADQKALLEKNTSLKGEQNILSASKKNLIDELSKLRTSIVLLQKEETALKENTAQLKGKNASLLQNEKNRLSALSVTVKNYSDELIKLRAEKQTIRQEIAKMTQELTVLQKSKKDSEKLPAMAKEYQYLNKVVTDRRKEHEKYLNGIAECKGEYENLLAQKQPLLEQLAKLRNAVAVLQKDENKLRQKYIELQGKNASLLQNEKNRLSALSMTIRNFSDELAKLRNERSMITEDLSKSKQELAQLQSQVDKHRKSANDLLIQQREYAFLLKKIQTAKNELIIQEKLIQEQRKKHSVQKLKMELEVRRLQEEQTRLQNRIRRNK